MRKIHTFSVPPNMVAPLLAVVAIGVGRFVFYGYIVILVIIVAYVLHIPFAVRSKRWVAAHPEAWDDKPQERRADPAGDSPGSAAPPIHGAARTAQPGRLT